MSCSHTGLANMAAMHTTQAPMSTLLRIRRNAQAEDVACRFATRCCTRWIFAIFFCRVNWLNSESVCASIIRLFRFALVTRTMALSSDAMSSDCQNSTMATTTSATTVTILSSSTSMPPMFSVQAHGSCRICVRTPRVRSPIRREASPTRLCHGAMRRT